MYLAVGVVCILFKAVLIHSRKMYFGNSMLIQLNIK